MSKQLRFFGSSVLILCVVLGSGCSDDEENSKREQRQQALFFSCVDEGISYAQCAYDVNGLLWVKLEDVDTYVEEETDTVDEPWDPEMEQGEDLDQMSMSELLDDYRPIMLTNNEVYQLSMPDTVDLINDMLNDYANGVPDDPGDPNPLPSQLTLSASNTNGQLRTVQQPLIVGSDNRQPAQFQDDFPNVAIASVDQALQSTPVCTAFKMLSHHTAITAAHCVYKPRRGFTTPKHWWFASTSFRRRGAPIRNCGATYIPRGWRTRNRVRFDYAVIRMKSPWPSNSGAVNSSSSCRLNDYNFGYFGFRTRSTIQHTEVKGYPASPPGLTYPALFTHVSNTWYFREYMRYSTDTTGGQSGSPVLYFKSLVTGAPRLPAQQGNQVLGIHKGQYISQNWGRRLDGGLIRWMRRVSN